MLDKIILVSKKDLEITWFNGGGGNGGQYRNKHNNCCRIYHPESGASGVGTKARSAEQNKKDAFRALCSSSKMKVWLSKKLHEIKSGKTVEQRVEEAMVPKNLKIEGIDSNGQWSEEVIDD